MESCTTFPQFHITAAVQKMVILYMIETALKKAENSLDRDVQKRVIGAICLVLGLYALSELPLDYAGLALLVLGICFMIAEAFMPTFGILGFGGIAAFVIGAAMLVNTNIPAFRVSYSVIAAMAAISAVFLIVLMGYVWRSQRRKAVSGAEELAGSEALVLSWENGEGYVWAQGERWHARGEKEFAAGQRLTVKKLDGLTLVVGLK